MRATAGAAIEEGTAVGTFFAFWAYGKAVTQTLFAESLGSHRSIRRTSYFNATPGAQRRKEIGRQ
jgi:hypothetical protein